MAAYLYPAFMRGPCGCISESLLAFLASIHDAGKITRQFQANSPPWLEHYDLTREAANNAWKERGFSHAKASQDALEDFLQSRGALSESQALWAAVLGAHHGRLARKVTDVYTRDFRPETDQSGGIDWMEERRAFILRAWEACGRPELPETGEDDPFLWLAAGFVTLADWIASNTDLFPADPSLAPADPEAAARAAVESLGLGALSVTSGLSFKDIFGYNPYEMQTAAWESISGSGVYVIEAPMGMGKTEAALMAAYKLLEAGKARGLYFGLPTQATSNRMFARVREFMEKICPAAQPAQLIHSNSWLLRDAPPVPRSDGVPQNGAADGLSGGLDAAQWFSSPRRALLAPVGVGTADQAMLSALAVKHFSLRRLALTGKVVILDEVHSYDLYSHTVIQALCHVLEELGCTVIILSATLTAGARESLLHPLSRLPAMEEDPAALPPYPLISCRSRGSGGGETLRRAAQAPESRDVRVSFTPAPEAAAEAQNLAAAGGQVLWVCNTVAAAQAVYAFLREARGTGSSFDLGLLHARLPFFLREERERHWMARFGKGGNRGRGAILVATQIVEQSVDLDADLLVTELAPTDMLLQRLGRLWRHDQASRPVSEARLIILAEETPLERLRGMTARQAKAALGGKGYVYEPYVLLRTLELWSGLELVRLPSQIRPLIHETYTVPETLPPGWLALHDEFFSKDSARKMLARMNTDIWNLAVSDEEGSAPTRLIAAPEHAFVLCRRRGDTTAELLDGSSVRTDATRFDAESARALHRNAVKIPEYRFAATPGSDAFLDLYRLQGWAVVDGAALRFAGHKTKADPKWDEELGILWPQQRNEP